jgi:hypothetical protein
MLLRSSSFLGQKHRVLLPCCVTRPRRAVTRRRLATPAKAQAESQAATAGLTTLPWTDSPEQQQALQDLSTRLQDCPYGPADVTTQQWFLRDRKFVVPEAEEKLVNMLKWRQEFRAQDTTWEMVKAEAGTGKAYVHSQKDVFGRPVIVIRVTRHVTGEYPLEDSKRLCVYMLEKALSQLPEGQETVLGIFDLRGFKNRNTDLGFVRFLVDIFFTYYPKRLGQVLFLEAPWIFQPGWSIVKPWLGKYAALVRFVNLEQLQSEYFKPDTVPDDFKA